MSRLLAYGFGAGLVLLVASPGLREPSADSYPLSTYPMFARARGKPWLDFVEGVDSQGQASHLPPSLLGSDEVMQAAATVRRAVQGGPDTLGSLCTRVAEQVAHEAAHASLVEVRVVGARFDPVRYFVEGPVPEERQVHHRCPVPGRP
jgi:hypothetical protein